MPRSAINPLNRVADAPAVSANPKVNATLFPEWDLDTLVDEDWHDSDDAFIDEEFTFQMLPCWLSAKTTQLVRAHELLVVEGQAEIVDKGDEKEAQESLGTQDKVLPEIVVLPSGEDWPPRRSFPLDRGFAKVIKPHAEEGVDQERLNENIAEEDVIGASILRLIAAYASSSEELEDNPFLWEAIYPQDELGRPCYNPGGKYAVKIYVCGVWRKVIVDDRIPVDINQRATIVSSQERREMWPMILLKAAYKSVYLMGSPVLQSENDSPVVVMEIIALVLSVLTGWLPSSIRAPPRLGSQWRTETITALVSRVQAGGTPVIPADEISLVATVADFPSSCPKRRTRPGYRQRGGRSREPTEAMLNHAAHTRNLAAAALRARFARARDELVLVVDFHCASLAHIRPILAISTRRIPEEANNDQNTNMVEALLEWSCATVEPSSFKSADAMPSARMLTMPITTLLNCASHGFVLAFSTRRNLPFITQDSRHWLSADSNGLRPLPNIVPRALYVDTIKEQATLLINFEADLLVPSCSPCVDPSKLNSNSCCPGSIQPKTVGEHAKRSVVLVLQELATPKTRMRQRTSSTMQEADTEPPGCRVTPTPSIPSRMMRLALPIDGLAPNMVATMVVPRAPQGKLYSICIEAPLGATATFYCSSPVMCGDLPTVYEQQGGLATKCTGTFCAIHNNAEFVLFRRMILPPDDLSTKGEVGNPHQTQSSCEEVSTSSPSFVDLGLELYFSDLTTADHVTMHSYDMTTGVTKSHPLMQLRQIRMMRGGNGILITAMLRTSRLVPILAGTWSLFVLSQSYCAKALSLQLRENDGNGPFGRSYMHCFRGIYTPNKNLCLFCDLVELSSSSFPLYVKLDVKYMHEQRSQIPIRLRIVQVADDDCQTRIEQTGTGSICLPCFWPGQRTGLMETNNAAIQPNTLLVLEAELDSNMFQLAAGMQSSQPYVHNAKTGLEVMLPAEGGIQWILSLHLATDHVQLRHNRESERSMRKLQQSWELPELGRAQRAAVLRTQALHNWSQKFKNNKPNAVADDKGLRTKVSALPLTSVITEDDAKIYLMPISNSINKVAARLRCQERDVTVRLSSGRCLSMNHLLVWRRSLIEGTIGRLRMRRQYQRANYLVLRQRELHSASEEYIQAGHCQRASL